MSACPAFRTWAPVLACALTAVSSAGDVDAWCVRVGPQRQLFVRAIGEPNAPFVVAARLLDGAARPRVLCKGQFPPSGVVDYVHTFPPALPDGFALRLMLAEQGALGTEVSEVDVPVAGGIPCQLLDFDYTLGSDEPVKGQVLSDEWAQVGMSVSATNGVSGHPDLAVVFDSAGPSGGDTDLATPGYGPGNDTALGKLLICAENDVDANADGLVDDPDDEEAGGRMLFNFDEDITFFSTTVLDVDGSEVDTFDFFDAQNNLLATIDIAALGDNSVQQLVADPPIAKVRLIELSLGGSGAVTRLRWCVGDVAGDGGL